MGEDPGAAAYRELRKADKTARKLKFLLDSMELLKDKLCPECKELIRLMVAETEIGLRENFKDFSSDIREDAVLKAKAFGTVIGVGALDISDEQLMLYDNDYESKLHACRIVAAARRRVKNKEEK